MSVHHYPVRAIRADYFSSLTGLTICAVPLIVVTAKVVTWILVPAAVLFAIYGLRTVAHQLTRVVLSKDDLSVTGIRRADLSWNSLTSLSLGYYSAWRNTGDGWMQLRLKGDGRVIRLESTLVGFHDIVRRAVAGAMERGVVLDQATISNLGILGVDFPMSEGMGE